MEQGYLLDTNIIIYFLQGRLTTNSSLLLNLLIDGNNKISFVTKIELLSHDEPDPEEAANRFLSNSIVFGVDESIIAKTILIRKENKIKLPDAIIAATAIVNNLTLITRNEKDFKNISGLRWINPF